MIQVAEARVLLLAVAIVIGGQSALAQAPQMYPSADSPVLARNPAGPAELAQFDVVAGDWDVTVTIPRRSGPPYVYQAASHDHWKANGHVMMQEWREPDASGIELRSFNPVSRKWDGRSLYVPQPGTWYENEAELVGGDIIATRHSIASDGRP